MNAGFAGPYAANLTYTLSANGTAYAIGNSTYTGDAELSLEMSVWKSTPSQVRMDVIGGTVNVDGQKLDVHSDHVLYRIIPHKLLIIAVMMENGNTEDDAYSDASNQTSTHTTEVDD